MNQVPIIDRKRCTVCRRCIEICPKKVLAERDGTVAPTVDECMLCSHCLAVCPAQAIGFDPAVLEEPRFSGFAYKPSIVQPGQGKADDLVNLFRSRRSTRRFLDKAVSRAVLDDLLNFAITAPSGSNCQEWQYIVINGRDQVWALAQEIKSFFIKLNRLARNPLVRWLSVPFIGRALVNYYRDHYESVVMALEKSETGIDLLFHGAPALVIIHSGMDGSTPLEDAQYASYNMCLLGHVLGLGTCYIGYAVEAINRDSGLRRYLSIPAGHRVHTVLALGYPAPAARFRTLAWRKPLKAVFR